MKVWLRASWVRSLPCRAQPEQSPVARHFQTFVSLSSSIGRHSLSTTCSTSVELCLGQILCDVGTHQLRTR